MLCNSAPLMSKLRSRKLVVKRMSADPNICSFTYRHLATSFTLSLLSGVSLWHFWKQSRASWIFPSSLRITPWNLHLATPYFKRHNTIVNLYEIGVLVSPLTFRDLLGNQLLAGTHFSSNMLQMYQPVELFQWFGFGEPSRTDHSAVFRWGNKETGRQIRRVITGD